MRKLSAMIMLFPVAVLFIGAVRLGSICTAEPAIVPSQSSCCATATTCHKTKDQPKQKSGCSCCLECPLCTLITFNPEYRLEVLQIHITTEYAVMPENPLSDYSEPHWKPPDHTPLL